MKYYFLYCKPAKPAGLAGLLFHSNGPKGKLHLLRLFPSEMTAQPENMPLATTAPSVKKQTSQARRLGWFAI
jgi:hypothetical protein